MLNYDGRASIRFVQTRTAGVKNILGFSDLRAISAFFFAAVAADTVYASCDNLPPASHDTIFESAHEYATTGHQSLDESGIVLFDYGSDYNNLGKWPNPFFNSSYAHALYRDWIQTNCTDESLRAKFLRHAQWFAKTHVEKNGMAVWTYPFRSEYFNVDAGWYSGIGQSQIAGVLLRAYALSNDKQYKELADAALAVYFRPMSLGGVVTEEGEDFWIQEVPTSAAPSNILNGHITGTFALMDIRDIGDDEKAPISEIIKRAIDTVRRNVSKYDAGFTSFYSKHRRDGKISSLADRLGYNALHVSQLLTLYKLDGDPVFLDWAMRLQAYDNTNDARIAKGSTDPKGHGPAEAAGWYGVRYWSHGEFPTWYEVAMKPHTLLDGVYLEGQTDASMVKDFSISTQLDGKWQETVTINDNTDRQLFYRFMQPVLADKVRVDIRSDNGNNNVAMVAIMPVRKTVERAPVADACNHRTSNGRYLLWDAFDSNTETRFTINCDGQIYLPNSEAQSKLTIGSVSGSTPIPVKVSADLKNWLDLGVIDLSQPNKQSVTIPANVFVRIDIAKSLGSIDGIKYEPIPEVGVRETFELGFRSNRKN